jgi:glycosyltransferase involved in cell wall biosynthesis
MISSNHKPLISVIVPVYNAASSIRRSLDSLLTQSYDALEIILIDDGSKDGSGAICDQFAITDIRVKVLHKENGGVSSARNAGLKIASGQYIGFLDPDDFAEPDLFESLYKCAAGHGSEVAICGHFVHRNGSLERTHTFLKESGTLERTEALRRLIMVGTFEGFLWNKLFASELINRADHGCPLRFDERIHMCEDLLFCCKCLLAADGIAYLPKPLYHYMIHENGLSNSLNIERRLTERESWRQVAKLLPLEISRIALERLHTVAFNIMRIAIINGTKDEVNKIRESTSPYLGSYLRNPNIAMKNKLRAILIVRFSYLSGSIWTFFKRLFHLRWQ